VPRTHSSALLWCACASLALGAQSVHAQAGSVLQFTYTPVTRAQVAIWIEDAAGNYLASVLLTESVGLRGIGNRPGASEFNSGYRWPYGRREGVLPIWAHRRASGVGAKLWPRVIYQGRPEGYASRLMFDQSPDNYFCLQFSVEMSSREELDAVSCASVFNSDKGRYLTADDVAKGYAEPFVPVTAPGTDANMLPLPAQSLYPPRLDVTQCTVNGCFDSADVANYAADARAVMPELDAITHATAPGDAPQHVLFSVPNTWPAGDYVAYIEVGLEGDYNASWNDTTYPTPRLPEIDWDSYSSEFGYPYRGQPSLTYQAAFSLNGTPVSASADQPSGRSSWDVWATDFGKLEAVSFAADDPQAISAADGSGADRLRQDASGHRFVVSVQPPLPAPGSSAATGVLQPSAAGDGALADVAAGSPVGPVLNLSLGPYPNKLRAYDWVQLSFDAVRSSLPLNAYEVRVATDPIVDEASFLALGRPAKNATDDKEGATALTIPTDVPPGQRIETTLGDLDALTHYWVGVRAIDAQNRHGLISVAEITTSARVFATVSPCFVATAAYGSPLAQQVGTLRRWRDRYLASHAPGRALVAAYYRIGPAAARLIEGRPWLRSLARLLLWPCVALAQRLP
jgi:hypothetical protein